MPKTTILDIEKKVIALKTEIEHNPSLKLKKQLKKWEVKMQSLSAWDRVLLARHPLRPHVEDVIDVLFTDFIELKGDRYYKDDPAIIGGIALFNGIPVTVIGHRKGRTTEEKIKNNFAMPHPEGYRKAMRLMLQAQKFKRPIMTFIDTPGAYPGVGAEARGQAEAIGQNLKQMSQLSVPIISVILGEGGSGGALALGVSNHILMTENSIYSVLSPEGYASILWKDSSKAFLAAEVMKLTSYDLLELKLIDGIINEPLGGAHQNPSIFYKSLKDVLRRTLEIYMHQPPHIIKEGRIQKYRNTGFFQRFNPLQKEGSS